MIGNQKVCRDCYTHVESFYAKKNRMVVFYFENQTGMPSKVHLKFVILGLPAGKAVAKSHLIGRTLKEHSFICVSDVLEDQFAKCVFLLFSLATQ